MLFFAGSCDNSSQQPIFVQVDAFELSTASPEPMHKATRASECAERVEEELQVANENDSSSDTTPSVAEEAGDPGTVPSTMDPLIFLLNYLHEGRRQQEHEE